MPYLTTFDNDTLVITLYVLQAEYSLYVFVIICFQLLVSRVAVRLHAAAESGKLVEYDLLRP